MKYDSIFEINLTNRLISTFRDPELQKHTKRNRKKYPYILVRVTLKTEQEKNTIHQRTKHNYQPPTELKKKNSIVKDEQKKDFNQTKKKNKLYIEKSTGRLKVTIEQKDCYNHHIFLFNLLIGLKKRC